MDFRRIEKELWTEEFKIEIFGRKRKEFIRTSKQMRENCIVSTVKHSRGAVIIWEFFFVGVIAGDFVQIKGIKQKRKYDSILHQHAVPSDCSVIGQILFYKHFSKLFSNDLKSKKVKEILQNVSWSYLFPNFLPLELIWD